MQYFRRPTKLSDLNESNKMVVLQDVDNMVGLPSPKLAINYGNHDLCYHH